MEQLRTENLTYWSVVKSKAKDYGVLMKFKLSLTVVFSAVMSFLLAVKHTNWADMIILSLGGFLVTGAASALNQVLERDYDKLMKRTENRPLAANRMQTSEAVLVAGVSALLGVILLGLFNPLTAFLGMVALISYSFVYTPMKRVSNIAVTIGAIPGALPMVIGCTAAQDGKLTMLALTLFAIQFIWQFPHFWAVAWLAHEDYTTAGFRLLPTNDNARDSNVGLTSFLYALFLLPFSCLCYTLGVAGLVSMVVCVITSVIYAFFAFQLYQKCDRNSARALMFCSFFYLPIVLFALYFDKI